jgi:hypothetical protein
MENPPGIYVLDVSGHAVGVGIPKKLRELGPEIKNA